MAYITPPTEIAATRRRRLLINGKSGSRKTTSILTCPRPIAIINYPGELGWDTVPDNDPTIAKRVWSEDSGKRGNPSAVIKEVERETLETIASGKYRSLWLEGLHHFTTLVLDDVTDGAYTRGEEFEPKLYGRAYEVVLEHITRMSNTNVPVIGWTCWAEEKAERSRKPGEKDSDVPKKILAALPGQLPHRIRGRFSVMLYQSLRPRKDAKTQQVVKNERGEPIYDETWQTRDHGSVLCSGLKGPKEVVERIPTFIAASYEVLEQEWAKAEQAANITQGGTK